MAGAEFWAWATWEFKGVATPTPESTSNGHASRREERIDIRNGNCGKTRPFERHASKVEREFGKSLRFGQNRAINF